MIVFILACISFAQDSAPPETVTPVVEAVEQPTQLAQSRQIVDCLKVYLADQVELKEKKLNWVQPEMVVYEKAGCLTQLPQPQSTGMVIRENQAPL